MIAYRVQRREAGEEPHTRIDTALETQARVKFREGGKRLVFCVVAVNKAGHEMASNVVTAGF